MYNYSANTQYIGKRFLYLTSCHSTNDLAKHFVQRGLTTNGMVIHAGNQTKGRGQQGSTWHSNPDENLTFSLVLKPQELNIANQFLFNKVVSIHLLGFFRSYFPEHAHAFHIKWPNDLYFYNKKIAGMLIENSFQGEFVKTSIVGIGLNVNQTTFDLPQASSLCLGLKQKLNRLEILQDLLSYLDENLPLIFYFSPADQKTIENIYHKILWRYREEHLYQDQNGQFKGIIEGVDEQGNLLLNVNNEIKAFEIKAIQFLNNTDN